MRVIIDNMGTRIGWWNHLVNNQQCSNILLLALSCCRRKICFTLKLTTPPAIYAYSLDDIFTPLICDLPAYSICWPTRLQRLMLQIFFLRRVRVRFRVTVYTQLAVGVYWDSTPLTASAEIFKVYISFTLFTCDCTLIYTLMYCVCQHTDPGMAQIHRGLTRFESGRYRNGIRAHADRRT